MINLYHENILEILSEDHLDLSKIVIPFSRLFKTFKTTDIYSGIEKIPFKERNREFKRIFQHEFLNCSKFY
ncbi:MAG: hypothetical protein ACFE9Z_09600 [Promethearchaeota archaeon]